MKYSIYTYPKDERHARVDYDETYYSIEEAQKIVESKVNVSLNCGGVDVADESKATGMRELTLYYRNGKWGDKY